MREVDIDLGQPPVLDSRHDAASGNAHGTISVKLLDSHESDYDCIIWETVTTTKWSRNQNSDYLPQRRKGRKEIKLPDLAFLASWRENNPKHA
jgi:hypothetical protein